MLVLCLLLAAAPPAKPAEPFAFADFTWQNGNARTKESPMDTKFFTPEIRADVDYVYSFNHPKDDTIGGSSEVFRSNEVHVTQLGVGGDFHYDNVRARVLTQVGLYSETTPRKDASPARGQWNLADAYRYLSEAYGGYHFNVLHGFNVDAGIFMSYVGLFSYYNIDNWAYQPSYVSSNTPWFFNGLRVQIYPTEHLKIEPWFVNGWQSYGRFNNRPGFGLQVLWRPNGWFSMLGNQYMLGENALNTPGRVRYHTDDSIELKYYDNQEHFLDNPAFSLTGDLGCEHGGGVSGSGNSAKGPKQSFIGSDDFGSFTFDQGIFTGNAFANLLLGLSTKTYVAQSGPDVQRTPHKPASMDRMSGGLAISSPLHSDFAGKRCRLLSVLWRISRPSTSATEASSFPLGTSLAPDSWKRSTAAFQETPPFLAECLQRLTLRSLVFRSMPRSRAPRWSTPVRSAWVLGSGSSIRKTSSRESVLPCVPSAITRLLSVAGSAFLR